MQIVIEEQSVLAHGRVEGLFAGVSKRRVADVVDQGQRFHQVDVETELGCDGASDLGDFEGMGQAVAEVIGVAAGEDLGLGFQTAKGAGVDDAVAVALEVVAIGMLGLGDAASAGLLHPHGVIGQHGRSLALRAIGIQQLAFGNCNQHSAQKLDGAACLLQVGGTPTGQPPGRRRYFVVG